MSKLTKEDWDTIVRTSTNEPRLIPLNIGMERNPAGTVTRCVRRPDQTTASAVSLRKILIRCEDETWDTINERRRRILELDPPVGTVEKTVLLGLIEMDEPSTTEQVLELMRQLDVEPADYHDLLAAIHAESDPLVGKVVMALGSHIIDSEGHTCYPRHVAFWKGERTMILEYQNRAADYSRLEIEERAKAPKERYYGEVKIYPEAWRKSYRFLARLKDFS